MRRPAGVRWQERLYKDKKKKGERKKRSWAGAVWGQFAENFKNATPRSARNEISQRILIQERSRAIADVNARYRLSNLPSERVQEEIFRYGIAFSRHCTVASVFFDFRYAVTAAKILFNI